MKKKPTVLVNTYCRAPFDFELVKEVMGEYKIPDIQEAQGADERMLIIGERPLSNYTIKQAIRKYWDELVGES